MSSEANMSFTTFFYILTLVARTGRAWAEPPERSCRCFPDDPCWPSYSIWQEFNSTLDGKLVATIPLAAPCHKSQFAEYNVTECENLQNSWTWPQTHYNSSSSVMSPFFANQSCDPFTGVDGQCVLGTYVDYAVNVGAASDVAQAFTFAKQHNIRIVIRNSGHDYNGKSTGAGALAIWTHHLKAIDVLDYNSIYYQGKVMKMGAGVQGFEAYAAAHEASLVVVGGECPTVGLAGGYSQGGGHSAVGSRYGMAADQVLEWEVVTVGGQHVTATRDNEYSDLFWALSGGGGGTYGVVLSMTSKAHPDMPTSGGNLTFTNEGVSQDTYWSAIETYHASLPAIVDEGIMSVSFFSNTSFAIGPMSGPGVNAERMDELIQPLTNKLTCLGMNYTKLIKQFPNYFEEFNTMWAPIEVGVAQYGGRLIPRSVVQQNNSAITRAYREIAANGGSLTVVGISVGKNVSGDVYNAVNPVWRETLLDTVITTPWNFSAPWSEMQALADKMTYDFIPLLEGITPGAGTYLNEGDFQDPKWKENYYGVNYDRLLEIKEKYDPEHTLYALTAVGSDYWEPQLDGRLCRASGYNHI